MRGPITTGSGYLAKRSLRVPVTTTSCGYGSRICASLVPDDIEQAPMDARDFVKIGMSAERTLVVPAERTVGHFVPGMPMVYATPMMILEMEMTSGDAI